MGDYERIHWHEGLFLRPHHMQMLQRMVEGLAVEERKWSFSYPYGVINSDLSRDALENMVVRFSRLRAVMPDGQMVDFPGNAFLPPLNVEEAMGESRGSILVYLAVPVWYEGRANVVGNDADNPSLVKRRFRVDEVQKSDENSGGGSEPIPVRRLNARLVLDSEDHSDLEVMPVLKLRRTVEEGAGKVEIDPAFSPPALIAGGAPHLQEMVVDLADQLEASRRRLLEAMGGAKRDEFQSGGGGDRMFRLRTLGKYSGRMRELALASAVTPFDLYLELRGLLGELSALEPEQRNSDIPSYDHDNVLPPFQDIIAEIRSMLGGESERFIRVPFEAEDGARVVQLEPSHFDHAAGYYIGVETDEAPSTVEDLVEDQARFKAMPTSLVDRAIFGFELERVHFTPAQLPSRAGLIYFRLRQSSNPDLWEMVEDERSLAVRWPGHENSDYGVALYMPAKEGD